MVVAEVSDIEVVCQAACTLGVMATPRPEPRPDALPPEGCPYAEARPERPLQLERHRSLHPDGQRLILSWFDHAWLRRDDEDATFESFIFAWISVNAWASCVTEQDQDREYMRRLTRDSGLRERFGALIGRDPEFRRQSEAFASLLPIFKAQQLRRRRIWAPDGVARRKRIDYYLQQGATAYEPACAQWHFARDEPVPNDWPHTISAIYRVRCNLFHGEKAAHSEMDRQIVRSAFLTLTMFFRGAHIL